MGKARNMVIAQSGGPSPVINSTLRGIVEAARDLPQIGTIYAARHGIEGVLKEELLDLSAQDPEEVALLRYTPAAGSIGTCRYKLKAGQDEDFERVIDVLRAHNVGYFIYIGGNDSMDTANKLAQLGQEKGLDLVGIGGPKTIDNDVGDSVAATGHGRQRKVTAIRDRRDDARSARSHAKRHADHRACRAADLLDRRTRRRVPATARTLVDDGVGSRDAGGARRHALAWFDASQAWARRGRRVASGKIVTASVRRRA